MTLIDDIKKRVEANRKLPIVLQRSTVTISEADYLLGIAEAAQKFMECVNGNNDHWCIPDCKFCESRTALRAAIEGPL